MNILLISATSAEIAPLIEFIRTHWKQEDEWIFSNQHHRLTILIGGVGMVPTTYALSKKLSNHTYDLAVQAGIGGSYDREIPLGTVVLVDSEVFADLGAEDHYNFLDVFDLGLEDGDRAPFRGKKLIMPAMPVHDLFQIRSISGLTVNMGSGSSFTALARQKKYDCAVESMEGAAFHYVCLQENVPFAQVRSVSNYVEARDRSKWKIKEAIASLNDRMISFFNKI